MLEFLCTDSMEDGPELPEPPLVEAAELEVELVAEPFCSSANLTFRTVEFPEAFPIPFPVK